MKNKIIMITLLLVALFFSACNVGGQEQSESDRTKVDSMEKSDRELHNKMDDARADRKESEARTKEAREVEQNASDASDQAGKSLRAEKRAQRAREKANEQARKTKNAIEKSENDR